MKTMIGMIATVGVWTVSSAAWAEEAPVRRSYQAHMAAAEKSLRLEEATELRRWLDGAPDSLRGWEWSFLNSLSNTAVRVFETPEKPVRIAISPRGDMIATVDGSVVRLRSWPALKDVRTIEGHSDSIYRVEFSPDGTKLITMSRDVTSRTWDIASGKEIARIALANPAFAAAAFSPDGMLAATCAWTRDEKGQVHGLIWVWDAMTGEVRAKERVGVKPLSSIRFTPDGKHILAGAWDPFVHVVGLDGKEIRRIELPDEDIYNAINDIAVSPDGTLVAAGTKDRTIRVFEVETGTLAASLRGHLGWIEGVAFSPDGAYLLSTSGDATARVWSTEDWAPIDVKRGHLATVRGGVWLPDSTGMVTCSPDGTIRAWSMDEVRQPMRVLTATSTSLWGLACSPDGSTLLLAAHDGRVQRFGARDGEALGAWTAHDTSTCHNVHLTADGTRLLTCSWDHTARLWDMAKQVEVAQFDTGGGVYACAISPDGATVALTGDNAVLIYDVLRGEKVATVAASKLGQNRLAFSSGGEFMAGGADDGVVRVWRTGDWSVAHELAGGTSAVESATFSADGRQLVTADDAGVVRGYDLADGKMRFAVDTGERGVNCARFSPDGARIAASGDHLFIIDSASGDLVLDLAPHKDSIWDLAWSPEGMTIYTCCVDGTFGILRARSGALTVSE